MRHILSILICAMLVVFAASPAAAHENRATTEITVAADALMQTLSPEQRIQAEIAFSDPERSGWRYVPDWALQASGQAPRRGTRIGDFTPEQKAALRRLLQVSLSDRGYLKADGIMSMDDLLRDLMVSAVERHAPEVEGMSLEQARQFGSQHYWFSLFRDQRSKRIWGWRLEGHHLSINFTLENGLVFGTPEFMGVEPATVPSGPNAGFQLLAAERSLGRSLIRSLTPDQQRLAKLPDKIPEDIIAGPRGEGRLKSYRGVAAAKLTPAQRQMLRQLIGQYAGNLRGDLASEELAQMNRAGIDKIYFAWDGSPDEGKPLYYAIHGPTLAIEFDNTSADPNHIHTVWHGRDDFGEDLLREHYREYPHKPR